MPLLSIITVTYNAENVLERTIKSIIGQTVQDFEYILVDGKSNDKTLSIIEKYKKHIDVLVSEKDDGIYDAMNTGMTLAKGDFIWFMNAGDEIASPNIVERILGKLEAKTDLIYGDALFVNNQGVARGLRSEVTPHRLPSPIHWKDFRYGMLVCHQSFIVAKSIAPTYTIENLSADLDFEISALKASKSQLYIPFPISRYLEGGVSNQQLKRSLLDRFKVMRKHFGLAGSIAAHFHILTRGAVRILRHGKYW